MKFTIVVIILIVLAGCAMITQGPLEEVMFTSNTDSLTVYVDNKNIGQTPTSVELWKAGYKETTFLLPDGQEYHYRLKTHANLEMLKDGVFFLLYIPFGIAAFGVDCLSGSGLSFNEEILNFKNINTDTLMIIEITTRKKKPEDYILVSGGLGKCFFDSENERSIVNIPEIFVERIKCYRDKYNIGYGINFEYVREMDNGDKVTMLPCYLLLKVAPFPRILNFISYFIAHGGFGLSCGEKDGEIKIGFFPHVYRALGIGIEYNRNIYAEFLWRGNVWVSTIDNDVECSSFALRVGYRFDL